MINEVIIFITPYLSWLGLLFGLLGGLFIAYPSYRAKVWGFEMWVYSNVFWLAFAYTIHSWAVAFNYIFFTVVSVAGIWTHLPLADAERKDRDSLLEIPKKI